MSGHGGGKPVAGTTDFDSMSHEQMYELLRSADMHTVSNLSGRLGEIAKTVNKIGNDLKSHVMALEWTGEGGEAFREWGNQTANATLKLGQYATDAGTWMGDVSQAIVEAHNNMPDLAITKGAQSNLHLASEHMKTSDSPNYEKSAIHASSLIETTRTDAAGQMHKLASSYVHAGTQINSLQPPTFPPPANQLGKNWIEPHVDTSRPGGTGDAQNYVTPGGTTRSGVSSVHGGQSGASDFRSASSVPDRHATVVGDAPPVTDSHMEIDSVTSPTAPPPTATPPGTPPAHGVGPGPTPPGALPPPTFGGSSVNTPPYKTGPGGGAFTGKSGGFPGGRAPRFTNSGEYVGGGTADSGRGPSPRPNGIVGGRPVESPNGKSSVGLPRGTVIGSEEGTGGSNSRQMTGRGVPGMHPGGQGGTGAGRNGLVGGRRLASEAGGVVGRPAEPGKSGARPFTQGGSGLVRGESEGSGGTRAGQAGRGGTMPHAGRGSQRRDDQGAERPDYLTEDEDTWQQGSRQVVPPVID